MLILPLLTTILIGPLFIYESLRLYSLFHTCTSTWKSNDALLANPTCSDPWLRSSHGEKQQELCKQAHEENLVSPMSCAWKRLWIEGEVYKVWAIISDSPIMVFFITLPTVLLFVYMCFQSCNQRAISRQQLQFQGEMYDKLTQQRIRAEQQPQLQIEQQQQSYYEPSRQQQRKRPKVIELIQTYNSDSE